MEFTGERVVPGKTPFEIYHEHLARYKFASLFTRGKIVLDVACGTGYGSKILLDNGAKKVYGVDISEKAIEYSKEYFCDKNLIFKCGDATNLGFQDNMFDVIVSFETVEHIMNYHEYLEEIMRVLKLNGIFIVSTPNKQVCSPNSEKPLNIFHANEFTFTEFTSLLTNYFVNLDIFGQKLIYNSQFWQGLRRVCRALKIKRKLMFVLKIFGLKTLKSTKNFPELLRIIINEIQYDRFDVVRLPKLNEKFKPMYFVAVCQKGSR